MASTGDTAPANAKQTLHIQQPPVSDSPDAEPSEKKVDQEHLAPESVSLLSESSQESREEANRLYDDLEVLRAERVVSHQHRTEARDRSKNRSRTEQIEDTFNRAATSSSSVPSTPPKSTWLTRLWKSVKKFPRVLRYVVYAIPPGVVILVPIFLDLFAYNRQARPVGGPGGVQLLWFGIWLEVVWLTLWASRLITALLPYIMAFVADTVGSANHKKWRDIGKQLELPTSLFIWLLTVLVSYHPILDDHRVWKDGEKDTEKRTILWLTIVWKIIIAFFVLVTLNLVEKILIKWIASSFHLRTYSHRIRENQMQVEFLVTLYTYAKAKLTEKDSVWDNTNAGHVSIKPPSTMKTLQENARHVMHKVGNAASRVAGDFTGRRHLKGNHPRKVVLELLRNTESSYTLARVFYRTFVQPGRTTITVEDLYPAFATQEDSETCFGVFDKDLNGDISMEELEMVCNEIHLEKKAIAASLKDLDSVIKKLDEVFMFLIVVIVIIVFISIISNSAAAALTSTGTFVLGLSWLLQATAQEFLQSIIFVFVKHPFDVGDRVTIYGNTGSMMRGDDYYVVEVSLLYTEFKKMQGHVVQAPNSILNNLFILNQRRSQGLADPIPLKLRFGTTEAQIEELKARMVEFCLQNKRDYAPKIITEVQTIDEVSSITVNFVYFHKSNYQNELLRLTRHNRFACELMRNMKDMGLETPKVVQPGGMRDMPLYWAQVPPPAPAMHDCSSQSPSEMFGTFLGTAGCGPSRRRGSRAAVVEAGIDYQDVYHSRKKECGMTRLPSIRQALGDEEEEEDGERHEGPRRYLAAGYEEPQKHMEKRYSIDSLSSGTTQTQRRRMMWPRRSASRGGNQGSISNAV